MGPNAKALVQLAAALLAAVAPALVENNWTDLTHWVNVAILAVGAYQVWNASNTDYFPKGKMYASVAMSVLMAAVTLLDGGLDVGEVIQLVIAALTPFGVLSARNTGVTNRPIAN